MKIKKFNIPIFNWNIILIEVKSKRYVSKIKKELINFKCRKKDIKKAIFNINNGFRNGATYFSNTSIKASLILLYNIDKKNRIKILCHEKRHIEDYLMAHLGINDIETAGYLAEYLAKKLLK